MDRDLRALWPAAEPPRGFAGRVVERALAEASPPLPQLPPGARAQRSWAHPAMGVLALIAGIAILFVGWRLRRPDPCVVFAAEPREVAIGERATALLARGAQIAWSGASVRQERGEVEYRVQPGGPFVVQTPSGTVQVLGTIFTVRLAAARAAAAQPEEQSMKMSKRSIAATGLTLGGLLFVAVREGTVRLSNADHQLVLSQGQAGEIGADGVPMRVDPAPTLPNEAALAFAPSAARRQPEGQHGGFDRRRADGVRQRAAERSALLHASAPAPEQTPTSVPNAPPPKVTPEEQERRRVYIRDAVREQYFPIARSCYEELLARQPKAAGKVVMSFAIVGDGDAGVVDHVEFDDGTTLDDPEFTTCMRESMYSTIFEPPPPGTEETAVVYPIELDPGAPEDVQRRHHPGRVQQESH